VPGQSRSDGRHVGLIAKSATSAGRYQIYFSPFARADVYLLDTETGKIWRPVTITNAKDINLGSAPEVWIYQERIDTDADFSTWSIFHTSSAAKSQ
jgi:hypothetical protein